MHRLEAGNVLCLKAFGAFGYLKFHCLAFVERFVSVHHDRGEMYENILPGLALDKTIALRSIEPLDCSLFLHFHYPRTRFPDSAGFAALKLFCFSWSRVGLSAGKRKPEISKAP